MKHPTGYARPRRLATPKVPPKKKTRLDLKRRPQPEPDGELGTEPKSHFWAWVGLVAFLHLIAISIFFIVYEMAPNPKPPEQFISLLPAGEVVKGTPGPQKAHKLGPTTAASVAHHASASATAPPPPAPITPPKPTPIKPILKPDSPNPLADKLITPPKPATPPKPKVKVDLTLADGPATPVEKPKPKLHHKKPAPKPTETTQDDDTTSPDSAGLSKEQIAKQLGDKLDPAGVKNATQSGTSGDENGHPNSFADFYASIRDQVMSQWQSPNLSDETAVNPVVRIHVEKDGRVPPESVQLIQSSGNPTYDDSAVEAAKGLGYLHQPLPDGCPPDIPITFKLTR